MTSASEAETDPSVCYRHPDRQSWILCQRCGRTICPECQILAPVGVQCPECVREANGGGVRWRPTGGGRRATTAASSMRRPSAATRFLTRSDGIPVSWVLAGIAVLAWLVGFFTDNAPLRFLSVGFGGEPWMVWRFATSWIAAPAIADGASILLFIFNLVLFCWFGPYVERMVGRSRFITVFFAASVTGAAVAALAGTAAYGLTPGLYGAFIVYGITAMRSGANVVLLWVLMAFNVVLTAVSSPAYLPQLIGGAAAGLGMWYLNERFGSGSGARRQRTIAGVVLGVLVLLAILRQTFAGG